MSNSWIISGTRVQLCSVRTLKEFCHKKGLNQTFHKASIINPNRFPVYTE